MRVIFIIVLAGIRRRRGGFFLHTIHTGHLQVVAMKILQPLVAGSW